MATAKKTTDWKSELQDLTGGTVILNPGTRKSLPGNEEFLTRGRMLGLLEEHLRRRKLKGTTKHGRDRLKGLFGGGE